MNRDQFDQMAQVVLNMLADHDRRLQVLQPRGVSEEQLNGLLARKLKRLLDGVQLDAWKWNDLAWRYIGNSEAFDKVELNPTFIETWLEVK